MPLRKKSGLLASAPARISLTLLGAIVVLLGIFAAVKPEMMVNLLHTIMPM